MVKPWDVTTIGDFLDFKNGLNKGKEYFGYGTPIVNYTDVYKKRGLKKDDINGRVSLSKEEIRRFDVRQNDVFFTRTSETPDEVGMSSVMLDDVEDCVFSGFVLRGRPKNDMFVPEYCKYCFSTEAVRNAIITGCTYTTRALTNGKQLSSIEILVPPKPEQEAIATALSDMDALIDNLEKLIVKKKAIKQGAMQELLTGKRRLPGFSGEWKEWTIEECSDFFDNQRIPVAAALRTKGNTPYYGANGILDYVEGYTHDGEYVLIAEDGANSLIDYPVLYSKGKIWVNNHAHVISSKRGIAFSDYIAYALKMVDFQGVLVGGTRAKLNSKTLKHIKLLLPELDEQRKIVIVLRDMDSEIEKLEKNLSKYKNIKSGMMSELLTGRIRLGKDHNG